MKKRNVMILVILLLIGFASVSTTLVLNGVIGIASNESDFNIIFTNAKLNNVERKDFIDPDTKQTLTFETNKLTNLDEEARLDYEVTNASRLYDADVEIVCNIVDEDENIIESNDHIVIGYEPKSMTVKSGKTESGSITARLFRVTTEDQSIKIKCTLNANATERDTLGEEYVDSNKLGGTLMAVWDTENYDFYTQAIDSIWNDNVRPYVTKVVFENALIEHETKTELIFDVSENQDGSVMAHAVENGKNVTYYDEYQSTEVNHVGYDLYIQSNGKIIANENSSYLFYGFINLQEIENIEYLDTSKATNMHAMFEGCSSLTTLDLSSFNTGKVIDMSLMFAGRSYDEHMSLTTLDLSNFDTSSVMDMNSMFAFCSNLLTLNLSSFDTSNVTNMGSMFYNCNNLTTLDLSNFDTHNVIGMVTMFYNCNNLTTLDLSNFDTSNVEYIGSMFAGCSSLTTLDISNFDTSKMTDPDNDEIFYGCKDELIVTVKDKTTQDWILALSSKPDVVGRYDRPAAWTTENVVIKEA